MFKVEDFQNYGKEQFETCVASATSVQHGLQAIASGCRDEQAGPQGLQGQQAPPPAAPAQEGPPAAPAPEAAPPDANPDDGECVRGRRNPRRDWSGH